MNFNMSTDRDGSEPVPVEFDGLAGSDRRVRDRRRMIGVGGLALLLLAAWQVYEHTRKPDFDVGALAQAPTVTVAVPGRTTVAATINATGTLAARHEMPVGSVGEGGQIASVAVEAGQWVARGQVLAVVDRSVQVEQLAAQQAQIAAADADARLAEANLDRALKLVDRGFISRADVDRLTATRDGARARVRVARAQFGETGARVRRLSIVAPEAGLVLERRVEPGQVVGAGGTVLFRIAKGGEMEMQAPVGEIDLAKIAPGAGADVTPVGSPRAYPGKVWQVAPFVDPQSRQGMVRIALAYAPGLRAGGFAGAVIRAGTMEAPLLPDSAILNDGKTSYVFVVGPNNRAERRNIRIGLVTDHGVAVASGLSGKEQVVLRAGGFLSAGEAVIPRMARP
jgi:RND family efflux transporter MFP subunit